MEESRIQKKKTAQTSKKKTTVKETATTPVHNRARVSIAEVAFIHLPDKEDAGNLVHRKHVGNHRNGSHNEGYGHN